jgi:hypothetical protein
MGTAAAPVGTEGFIWAPQAVNETMSVAVKRKRTKYLL